MTTPLGPCPPISVSYLPEFSRLIPEAPTDDVDPAPRLRTGGVGDAGVGEVVDVVVEEVEVVDAGVGDVVGAGAGEVVFLLAAGAGAGEVALVIFLLAAGAGAGVVAFVLAGAGLGEGVAALLLAVPAQFNVQIVNTDMCPLNVWCPGCMVSWPCSLGLPGLDVKTTKQ